MKSLLIATTNPGKLTEITKYIQGAPFEVKSLKDLQIDGKPEETGATFKENALLKARYYFQQSGMPTLADDGGFEIEALGGEPGVKSHRWVHANRDSTDSELIAYTLERLRDVPLERRQARLHLVLAFVAGEGCEYTTEGVQRGIVPMTPSSVVVPGFPYRSLLYFPEIGKYYNELTESEHELYNHRKRALKAMVPYILEEVC
jgi:XTP/dITP diphosphohydrolase